MNSECPCNPCACQPCTCGCGPSCTCGERCSCDTPAARAAD